MVKKATLGVLVMLLFIGLSISYGPSVKAQTASPSQAVITVSGVPSGTTGLAVEVTVDTSIVTLGAASSSVSGGLAVTGSMSEGVGIIGTSGDLPSTFTITVPLTGVAAGTSAFTVGMVLDMLGGTAITGASASADTSSVTVSAGTTTSTSSTTSGAGGQLSTDTFTVTVNGTAVNETSALNLTVAFGDSSIVQLDTGVTFMGTSATQLLTDVNASTGVLSVVWSGNITDGVATITGMLKPGTMAGTTSIGVTKVEAAGGQDITGNVAVVVNPTSVTNGATSTTSGGAGTFTLIGPNSATGPGKVAVAFTAEGTSSMSATLNGKKVDFVDDGVGIAIVELPDSGTLDLELSIGDQTVDLGSISVDAGEGKTPKVNSARASNKSSKTTLKVNGKNFVADGTSVEIIPTDHEPSADPKVKKSSIKATLDSSECIPKGSYVNVSTDGGTGAKKIKVSGMCDNPLVE